MNEEGVLSAEACRALRHLAYVGGSWPNDVAAGMAELCDLGLAELVGRDVSQPYGPGNPAVVRITSAGRVRAIAIPVERR